MYMHNLLISLPLRKNYPLQRGHPLNPDYLEVKIDKKKSMKYEIRHK
jgi:hypothetical protein